MSQRFKALTDFDDPETKSTYCRGLKYTIRAGNTQLATKVKKWVNEGKVELVAEGTEATVKGKGESK